MKTRKMDGKGRNPLMRLCLLGLLATTVFLVTGDLEAHDHFVYVWFDDTDNKTYEVVWDMAAEEEPLPVAGLTSGGDTGGGTSGGGTSGDDSSGSKGGNENNHSGLGDGTNPGQGGGTGNSPNQGTNNPNNSGNASGDSGDSGDSGGNGKKGK